MNHLKKLSVVFSMSLLAVAGVASAHVVVRPDTAGVGAFTTFNMSVPGEQNADTVALTLDLPDGLNYVTPTVKPGWTITTKTEKRNGADVTTAITWKGGKIPAHMRDDFSFSAQVPAQETSLSWKAYQTYSNGNLVSWELGPNDPQPKTAEGKNDFSKYGPASVTKVVNDLTGAAHMNQMMQNMGTGAGSQLPLVLSIAALALSVMALMFARRR